MGLNCLSDWVERVDGMKEEIRNGWSGIKIGGKNVAVCKWN